MVSRINSTTLLFGKVGKKNSMKKFKVSIKSCSSYLPPRVVTNKEISDRIDTTSEWIYQKLGIKERRVVTNESVSDMGYKVALSSISLAKIDKNDIDMIIVATSSPEKISPSVACTIHSKLNLNRNIPAFDINAVCSGFVYAMSMAASLIDNKVCEKILVISSEAYSKNTNWDDRHCVFFGDGAGAVILESSERGWMSFDLKSDGGGTGMTGFQQPLCSPFIMKGKEVWNQAVSVLPSSILEILEKTNTKIENIDMIIPHQPSINILKIIAEKISFPMGKVKTVMDKYGNIAGASVPIALSEAIQSGEIKKGNTIILTAIGSGWTWGSILIKYE